MSATLNGVICGLDMIGAFVIVALMLETTKRASIEGFIRGDAQGRWAMFRRAVYALVAIALFAKSIFILDGKISVQPLDGAIWIVVLFALFVFPALRAFGVIDQDRWLGFRR